MREAAIQIEQVSKSFQERKVLKNISCELNWGQVYGIVGNNGSGKTVLMKCICGLLPYDEVSVPSFFSCAARLGGFGPRNW